MTRRVGSTLNNAAQSYNATQGHVAGLAVSQTYSGGLTQLNSAAMSQSVTGTGIQGFAVPHFQGYAAEQVQSDGYANAAVAPAVVNSAVNAIGSLPQVENPASFQSGTFNSVPAENRGAVNEDAQPVNGFPSTAPLNGGSNMDYSGSRESMTIVPGAAGGTSSNGTDDGGKSVNKGEIPPAPTTSVLSETSMHFSAPLQQAAASPPSDQATQGGSPKRCNGRLQVRRDHLSHRMAA
jgi:hypothetical protein